jgi:hypothetical protein
VKFVTRPVAPCSVIADVALWAALIAVAGLATFAVKDYERSEAERLQRVHTAGMVAGLQLCPGSER